MSYKDLYEDPDKFLNKEYKCKFSTCSELFENDHLLDLCTDDKKYRDKSIKYMKKLIKLTTNLNKYFPTTSKPAIITNCGGFSRDEFISVSKRNRYYDNLIKSLKELSNSNIEILPQLWRIHGILVVKDIRIYLWIY